MYSLMMLRVLFESLVDLLDQALWVQWFFLLVAGCDLWLQSVQPLHIRKGKKECSAESLQLTKF